MGKEMEILPLYQILRSGVGSIGGEVHTFFNYICLYSHQKYLMWRPEKAWKPDERDTMNYPEWIVHSKLYFL